MHVFRVTHDARDAKFAGPQIREGGRIVVARPDLRRETISELMLAETVRGDVIALLNTVRLHSAQSLDDAPNVARSILNYGFPDLLNRTLEGNRTDQIGTELERVLARHEPRLAANSIKAERDKSEQKTANPTLRFHVRAAIRANPVDLPLEFVAEVESTTGKIRIDSH